jgi:NAD/NADP transhydrogenase beta subunit
MTATRTIGRRWRIAASLARATLSTIALLALYYRVPLDRPADLGLLVWLVVGLVIIGAAIGWQARAIAMSDLPRLRAVETAAAGLAALLILYASVYVVMSHSNPDSFTEVLGRTDALYFTMTVFATVGFGDITPTTEVARIITMTQMLVGILAVGLAAKMLVGAVQDAVARGPAAQRPSGGTAARAEQSSNSADVRSPSSPPPGP